MASAQARRAAIEQASHLVRTGCAFVRRAPARKAHAEDKNERRFDVDVERVDELVDWALATEWDVDEGERIRREAWR